MTDVKIILPACSDDEISEGLRHLVKMCHEQGKELVHGFLGGAYGYGCLFENETFSMFPFYWDDCTCGYEQRSEAWHESHPHAPTCYQERLQALKRKYGTNEYGHWYVPFDHKQYGRARSALCREMGLDPKKGSEVHCTCERKALLEAWLKADDHDPECPIVKPNFRHKPTGYTVRWYKYIGRDMEIEGDADFRDVLADCLRSIAH